MDDDRFDELRQRLGGDVGEDGEGRAGGAAQLLAGAGAVVVLALAVVLFTAARPTDGGTPAPKPAVTLEPAPEPVSPSTSTAPPVARVWPNEPVDIAGNEVRTSGHRWTVGAPGDVIAVGDWDCDGTTTPGVLRAATGRLHLFDKWATDDTALTASPGPTVPINATALEPRGCGLASVRTDDGRTIDVMTREGSR